MMFLNWPIQIEFQRSPAQHHSSSTIYSTPLPRREKKVKRLSTVPLLKLKIRTSSMAAKKKKTRVPDILWRLFGNRARTLADTILALIPPSPERENACHCSGKLCLGCCGDESSSFLVRPEDPSDYYKLLTRCFVVVSEVPHPPLDFDLRCFWSHREVKYSSASLCAFPLT